MADAQTVRRIDGSLRVTSSISRDKLLLQYLGAIDTERFVGEVEKLIPETEEDILFNAYKPSALDLEYPAHPLDGVSTTLYRVHYRRLRYPGRLYGRRVPILLAKTAFIRNDDRETGVDYHIASVGLHKVTATELIHYTAIGVHICSEALKAALGK